MIRRILSLFALAASITASAYDFAVSNSDGVTIYYSKISPTEVSVTYKGPYVNSGGDYSGDINIPSTVTYSDNSYSVTTIGEYAFSHNDDLISVKIPDTVTSISDYAFYGDPALSSVTIGNSVTEIGEFAFYYCSNLIELTIPDSVTTISSYAFGHCDRLVSVTIPHSVNYIGGYAFYLCRNMTTLKICNENPSDITLGGGYVFDSLYRYCTLYVPRGCTELYKSSEQWNGFFYVEEFDLNPDPEPEPEPDLKGDVNGDGIVDVRDINAIIEIILGN